MREWDSESITKGNAGVFFFFLVSSSRKFIPHFDLIEPTIKVQHLLDASELTLHPLDVTAPLRQTAVMERKLPLWRREINIERRWRHRGA